VFGRVRGMVYAWGERQQIVGSDRFGITENTIAKCDVETEGLTV
jgi:hypothetical protein